MKPEPIPMVAIYKMRDVWGKRLRRAEDSDLQSLTGMKHRLEVLTNCLTGIALVMDYLDTSRGRNFVEPDPASPQTAYFKQYISGSVLFHSRPYKHKMKTTDATMFVKFARSAIDLVAYSTSVVRSEDGKAGYFSWYR